MTKREEIEAVIADINSSLTKYQVRLDHANNCYYARLFENDRYLSSLFGGFTPKDMLLALYAFRSGMRIENYDH